MSSVADRWRQLAEHVARTAEENGRQASDVTIVGVTKYVGIDETRALLQAGCRDLGESRPQSLWSKAAELKDLNPRWHLIGHLQRNKARRTISWLELLHSLDSLRLAEQLDCDSSEVGCRVRALIEVNVTGDESKTGLKVDELWSLADSLCKLQNIDVIGLMGMAGRENTSPRVDFAMIRETLRELQKRVGSRFELKHLSMGMSGDFEDAIREGATIIRIGSALFE